MLDQGWLTNVIIQVEERGLFHAPRPIVVTDERGKVAAAVEGEIQVGEQMVTMQVALLSRFPEVLPHVYLKPWDCLGFLPHVDTDGYICFSDKEGLVLDRQRPIEIIREALDRSVHVLLD